MPDNRQPTICTVMRLRRSTRKATRVYDRHFTELGIGIAQFGILQAITFAKHGSISEIADSIDMERSTLTRNLRPLVNTGLVNIEEGKNKRVRSVSLTNEGLQLLKTARRTWRKAQAEVRDLMGEDDLQALHGLLAQLLERLPNPEIK